MLARQIDGALRHSRSDAVRHHDHFGAVDLLFFVKRDLVDVLGDLLLQPPDQLVLRGRRHIGIAALVVGQAGDVDVVAFARTRHVGNQIFARLEGMKFARRNRGVAARRDFNLFRRRNHDLLRHVSDHFVHHDEYRAAILLGIIERGNGQVETFLRRVRAQRDHFVVAVRAPAHLHHVGLSGKRGQSGGRSAALHVHEDAGRFRHHRQANVFHHQREARTGGHGESLGSAPYRALNRDRGGQLVFHLDKGSAHGGYARGEALHDFG